MRGEESREGGRSQQERARRCAAHTSCVPHVWPGRETEAVCFHVTDMATLLALTGSDPLATLGPTTLLHLV